MNNHVAGTSAPVSAVVVGADNLDVSLNFYHDTLGLELIETRTWEGPQFEQYWRLPTGSTAKCAFLGHGPDPVGRIQLMEFDAPDRKLVRKPEVHRATGLFNLNIYSSDIAGDYEKLKAQGFSFWSEPSHNDFGPEVGGSIEMFFDAPDGVVINLIQLVADNPDTLCGKILAFIAEYERTTTGFTAVATTAHGVADMEKALAFYYGPLHMTLFMESVLEGADTNRALALPEDARTQIVLVQGNHEYGKIALSSPLNDYELADLVADAVPPNIGYLAQSFEVRDIDEAASACAAVGAEEFSGPMEIDLPGRGRCQAMVVRNPGSGALQELYQLI